MVIRLLLSILLYLRRKVGLYGIASLALLYTSLFIVILNLSNLVRGLDDERTWLTQISFAALCFGWWGGKPKQKLWLIWAASILCGLLIVFTHVGNLWPSMLAVFRSAIFMGWSLLDETLPGLPALISLSLSWNEWMSALYTVFAPVQNWLYGLTIGEFSFDPTVTLILWSSVLGYFSFWAGWATRRLRQPLVSLLPAGVLLAASFSYVRQSETIFLAAFVALVLAMVGLNQQHEQERRWRRTRVDYAEDLRIDALASTGAISMIVTVIAVLVPIFNLRQVIDFFTTPPQVIGSSESADVGESLGLDIPEPALSPFQKLADGGLPRLHLLGTGPELSEQIVMLVEVDDPTAISQTPPSQTPAQRYYWRSLTYDTYTGLGWLTGKTTSVPYREGVNTFPPVQPPPHVVRQHVRLTEDLGEFVFSAGDILTLDWPYSIAWRTPAEGEPRTDQFAGIVNRDDYQVDSILPSVSPSQLRSIRTSLPDWIREKYLALPEGIPARVYDLAASVTIAQPTAYDRAIMLERYLRSIPYSLDLPPPPTDQDIVDYFLFDLQRGYCDYYATAMVVMARASGLPARLAVGYASGKYDPANDRYVVTADQAHSWAEIYFDGVGWVPFEPTGGQPEIVRTEMETELSNSAVVPSTPFEPVWMRTARRVGWGAAGLIVLGIIGFLGWNLWENWRFRHLSPDEMTAHLYFQLHPAGKRLAVQAHEGATPYEFAQAFFTQLELLAMPGRFLALPQGQKQYLVRQIRTLTEYFVRAAYAPDPLTEADRRKVIRLWQDLRWRLRWVSMRQRVQGIGKRK